MSRRTILRAGALEVQLLPSIGGSIARFDRTAGAERQPLLRGADDAPGSVLDTGCFPLVPYVNRIRGGQFAFRGEIVRQAPNMPPDPSPLHGHGWLAPWTLDRADEAFAELSFSYPGGEWPWTYSARQNFALDPDGLSVSLSCRNESSEPMPCGLGLHPYFPCDAETVLDTKVESVWTIDADVLPVERIAATGHYDLAERRICGQDLDHGFGGWSGEAWLSWPGTPAGLRMSSPDAAFFQVYSPPQGGLVVVEPVQHANAALNAPEEEWAALGLVMLEPGEQRSLNVRFAVIASEAVE